MRLLKEDPLRERERSGQWEASSNLFSDVQNVTLRDSVPPASPSGLVGSGRGGRGKGSRARRVGASSHILLAAADRLYYEALTCSKWIQLQIRVQLLELNKNIPL